ncbi:MAG: hypothetical protein ABS79_05190 [Planctomycetes bacterium SCN 63-9]|nr:MAG: hypothetical protein ABS79_05190 [Planctomycetes bacterium SCN 63-9]
MRKLPASMMLIGFASTVSIALSAHWTAPYRYDGAGYAVLARALSQGNGYRAIDHPDRPYHAHFPPGYPIAIAVVGKLAGNDIRAVHLFSLICSVGATLAAYRWFVRLFGERVGLTIGLALALNWSWGRAGGSIQSEPLFELLGQLAILVVYRLHRLKDSKSAIVLGLLLGGALLTRHVAIALIAAILIDLILSRRWRDALLISLTTCAMAIPWIAWVAWVSSQADVSNQANLLMAGEGGIVSRIGGQALFYVRRIPDQITGPFVEVATVFRKSSTIRGLADAWAIVASLVVFIGWSRLLCRPKRRLAGLIPIATLGLLLIWPFTEAGRFLIPLIPCILVGAVEGLASIFHRGLPKISEARLRLGIAILLLAASLPYTLYDLSKNLTRGREVGQDPFDSACAWLLKQDHTKHPGPILTRHPGEVFLQTGRQALDVSTSERAGARDATPEEVAATIDRYKVAYLLIDDGRYANAPPSPLARFVEANPRKVRKVWTSEANTGSVSIYEVEGDLHR